MLSVEVVDQDGNTDLFKTTPEHPFHVEGWDGTITTEGLHAALGVPSIEEHVLFPSDEKTKFGLAFGVRSVKLISPIFLFATDPSLTGKSHLSAALRLPAGQWDALKTGDQLSIRGGVDLVAGDKAVS